MMDPNVLMLLLLCTVILLPIIPAYFLFHALPANNAAEVSGPWQGLNLKLGGAFAGYFIVVLMVFSAYQMVKPHDGFQVWDVSGNITDANGQDVGPISAQDFSASPSWLEPPAGGNFHMYVFTRPGNNNGSVDYPVIYIRHGENQIATFSLDPKRKDQPGHPDITFNTAERKIFINNVSFTRVKPYNDNLPTIQLAPVNGSAPQPVPNPTTAGAQ